MGKYYGNNDWRDYEALKHYGVKGMKWGKRKLISLDSGNSESRNQYSYKNIGVNGRNGRLLTIGKTTNKRTGTSYYEATFKRRKTGDTYNKSKKNLLNYSDDEDYRTVGVKVNKNTLKKKLSSVSSSAKSKGKSIIAKLSKKKVKRRR